jgi:hypothetical protein
VDPGASNTGLAVRSNMSLLRSENTHHRLFSINIPLLLSEINLFDCLTCGRFADHALEMLSVAAAESVRCAAVQYDAIFAASPRL